MICHIKKVPWVLKNTKPKSNYEFFVALVENINKAIDTEDLRERMHLLFAMKIQIQDIFWDYGWDEQGLLVWYIHPTNEILFVPCDTESILNDI